MKVARSVGEILAEHVTLEVECVDRLYLNLYVPILQRKRAWPTSGGTTVATTSPRQP